jgi:hypothetical protein
MGKECSTQAKVQGRNIGDLGKMERKMFVTEV